MQKRYKSVAQKRKEKKQHNDRATAAVNQSHSLFSFGFVAQHSHPDSGSSINPSTTSTLQSSTQTIDSAPGHCESVTVESVVEYDTTTSICSSAVVSDAEYISEDIVPVSESLSLSSPTDRDTSTLMDNCHFDISSLNDEHLSPQDVEIAIKFGPKPNPSSLPKDCKGRHFPINLLRCKLRNGDYSVRDWLVWSESRNALCCFSCRLFN
jgi:hypothetical protein